MTPGGQFFVTLTNGGAKVLEVTSAGAVVRTVSAGGALGSPYAIVSGPAGELYVAEFANPPSASPGTAYGSIVRVDPGSGAQSVLASGPAFFGPYDLALTPSGSLYSANAGYLASRRYSRFTITRLSDGVSQVDAAMQYLTSYFVTASGSDDPWMNYCSPISFSCFSPMIAPRSQAPSGNVNSPWLSGPMIVVPFGTVPVRRNTWGSLKVRYR